MTMHTKTLRLADPDVIADPYPYYDALRETDPVHCISDGVYFLTRYADCAAALTDQRLSNRPAPFALLNKRHSNTFFGAEIAQNLIAFRDAPDVTRARKALASRFVAFTKTCAPLLSDLAQPYQGKLANPDTQDFVTLIAQPFALESMCKVFGFPTSDAGQLKAWSADFFYLFHAIPDRETLLRLNATLAAFRSYTQEIVQERRLAPRDDLISKLVQIDDGLLDDTALTDNIMLLAADGVENVWAGMANALMVLRTNQAHASASLAAGRPWSALLSECLRLESPGQYQGRIARDPLEIGGVEIRKYNVVLVGLAAANRDPAVFESPAQFRADRQGARDLAFGLGPHACLGRSLVQMQMSALFQALAPALEDITCHVTPQDWAGRAGHRWLSRLPVTRLRATSNVPETLR